MFSSKLPVKPSTVSILLVLLAFYAASQDVEEVGISSDGSLDTDEGSPRLDVISPKDGQTFNSDAVPVAIQVATKNGAEEKEKVCWKKVPDPHCGVFRADGHEWEAVEARIRNEPYFQCETMPFRRMVTFESDCWILQFDLMGSNGAVVETAQRAIDVLTVDELVVEVHSNLNPITGGIVGLIDDVVRERGVGLVLQFGMGEMSAMLSASMSEQSPENGEETIFHSFDSLYGLSENWRDGYEKGRFTYDGMVPFWVHHMLGMHFHGGWVNETLPRFLRERCEEPVGLLMLDVKVESDASFVLDRLVCRLREGSLVVFGSYFNYRGWRETAGERSAWLSAVDRFGIEFKPLGFHSTVYVVRIQERPQVCSQPSSNGGSTEDTAIKEWARSKMRSALKKRETAKDLTVRELKEVIAVDPNNAEALGHLAFLIDDPDMIEEAFQYAHKALLIQQRMPPPGTDPVSMLYSLRKQPRIDKPFDRWVRKQRLHHDLEQFRYLLGKERLPLALANRAIAAYEETLAQYSDVALNEMVELTWEQWGSVGPYFNRVIHIPALSRVVGGALNPALDFEQLQADYTSSDPHVVVVDDFLSDAALRELLRYYQEATIYYGVEDESYVGTYKTEGFGNPVLAQVVEEIVQKMPILCGRKLVHAWVFKYDDQLPKGIAIHADQAAVNFNLWLSENGSVDPDHGGLVVYTTKPPEDWDVDLYNTYPIVPEVFEMLEQSGYKNVTVPYRQNRLVMFDSKLFHTSDVVGWKPGYATRRINLTLLFGEVVSPCS